MTAKPSTPIDRHANRVARCANSADRWMTGASFGRAHPALPCRGLLVAVALMAMFGSAQAQAQAPTVAAPSAAASASVPGPDPRIDPGLTSLNIHLSGKLTPTAAHPMAGFWKLSCQDAFGLAIAAAGPAQYSVSFCGPGACYKPGTYAADTSLIDDPLYRVTSAGLLGVKTQDDKIAMHTRCWPPSAR